MRRLLVAAVLLLAACSGGAAPPSSTQPPLSTTSTAPGTQPAEPTATSEAPTTTVAGCPETTATITGTVAAPQLAEVSGVAVSRSNPGVLWVHNDSGDAPALYALTTNGTLLGTYELAEAGAVDWEDVAMGPGPAAATDYVYVGDIGDNSESREDIVVYRVPEPAVRDDGGRERLTEVEAFRLTYPDGPHDAEALLVDPRSGDMYVVDKDVFGVSNVYRVAAPLANGTELESVGTIRLGLGGFATGGDISPAGDVVAIRTYTAIFLWARAPGDTVADALAGTPCIVPVLNETQGEAVGFGAAGEFYTLSEGAGTAVQRFRGAG